MDRENSFEGQDELRSTRDEGEYIDTHLRGCSFPDGKPQHPTTTIQHWPSTQTKTITNHHDVTKPLTTATSRRDDNDTVCFSQKMYLMSTTNYHPHQCNHILRSFSTPWTCFDAVWVFLAYKNWDMGHCTHSRRLFCKNAF